jgi:opacity protein-like surface antigen
MSEKRRACVVVAVAVLLAASAAAQDEKNEVFGLYGVTVISDQGLKGATFFNPFVRSGKGRSFEVGYARHLLTTGVYGLSLEVPAMFNLDEDLNAGEGIVPIDYKEIFVTPSARLNLFPVTAVSPWVSLGGGFGHFSQNKNLIFDGGPNPGKSTTSGVLQAGIGLDVKIWRRLKIRGEGRDYWSGHPDFPLANTGKSRQHNFYVGAGARWDF